MTEGGQRDQRDVREGARQALVCEMSEISEMSEMSEMRARKTQPALCPLEGCGGISSEHNQTSTNSGSMGRQDGRGYQPMGVTRASSRRNDIVRGNVVRICAAQTIRG